MTKIEPFFHRLTLNNYCNIRKANSITIKLGQKKLAYIIQCFENQIFIKVKQRFLSKGLGVFLKEDINQNLNE